MFREGSTIAIANNVPLLNATDEADVVTQMKASQDRNKVPDLNAVQLQKESLGKIQPTFMYSHSFCYLLYIFYISFTEYRESQ